VEKVYLELAPPTLHDTVADDIRLYSALGSKGVLDARLDYIIATEIATVLRRAHWKVTAVILGGKEVIEIEEGDTRKRSFGVAVDIGTTKSRSSLLTS